MHAAGRSIVQGFNDHDPAHAAFLKELQSDVFNPLPELQKSKAAGSGGWELKGDGQTRSSTLVVASQSLTHCVLDVHRFGWYGAGNVRRIHDSGQIQRDRASDGVRRRGRVHGAEAARRWNGPSVLHRGLPRTGPFVPP